MLVTRIQSCDSHVSELSSTGRKAGHATNSTTSGIKVDETGYLSKQATSSMGDKENRARDAIYLYRRYNEINV